MIKNIRITVSPKTEKKLKECSDKQLYAIARKTLDMSIQSIPRDTGKLRLASSGFRGKGVVKTSSGYAIGSDTYYASKVWKYPDTTNWSTPGTNGEWYQRTWNKNKSNIIKMAIAQNKLK